MIDPNEPKLPIGQFRVPQSLAEQLAKEKTPSDLIAALLDEHYNSSGKMIITLGSRIIHLTQTEALSLANELTQKLEQQAEG